MHYLLWLRVLMTFRISPAENADVVLPLVDNVCLVVSTLFEGGFMSVKLD